MVRMIAKCAVTIAALVAVSFGATAQADYAVPAPGMACAATLRDVMTVLPDGVHFLVCQGQGDKNVWYPLTSFRPERFPFSQSWLSYGPEITLHGEGSGNPNLTSGQWTAHPRDPATQCGASQIALASPAGALTPATTSQSEVGQSLSLLIVPKLVTIALTGDCVWSSDSV